MLWNFMFAIVMIGEITRKIPNPILIFLNVMKIKVKYSPLACFTNHQNQDMTWELVNYNQPPNIFLMMIWILKLCMISMNFICQIIPKRLNQKTSFITSLKVSHTLKISFLFLQKSLKLLRLLKRFQLIIEEE